MTQLEVWLYGEPIGALERHRGGSVFSPNDGWRWARFQPLLGLSWLQDPAPRRADRGLPVWFEALLPDRGSALRSRLCAATGVPEDDSFGLLGAVGGDLAGAVRVYQGHAGSSDEDAERPSHRLPSGPLHFSLAGAQLKFSLVLRDNKLVLPIHGEAGSFIAKLPGEQFPSLPAVEKLTLDWATRCGIETPDCDLHPICDIPDIAHLERFPGELCLVVKRYDRSETGPVHQEDLCQVFSLPPTDRYDDSPRPRFTRGYASLLPFIRDACGDEAAVDFTRRLAFVLASGNSDAHLQNWSILLPQHGPFRLAPAYDQVSVIAFPRWGWDRDDGPRMALPFGGVRRMAEVDGEALRRFARDAGDPSLAGPFMHALACARAAWQEIESQAILPHREAIAAHWARVPLLEAL